MISNRHLWIHPQVAIFHLCLMNFGVMCRIRLNPFLSDGNARSYDWLQVYSPPSRAGRRMPLFQQFTHQIAEGEGIVQSKAGGKLCLAVQNFGVLFGLFGILLISCLHGVEGGVIGI